MEDMMLRMTETEVCQEAEEMITLLHKTTTVLQEVDIKEEDTKETITHHLSQNTHQGTTSTHLRASQDSAITRHHQLQLSLSQLQPQSLHMPLLHQRGPTRARMAPHKGTLPPMRPRWTHMGNQEVAICLAMARKSIQVAMPTQDMLLISKTHPEEGQNIPKTTMEVGTTNPSNSLGMEVGMGSLMVTSILEVQAEITDTSHTKLLTVVSTNS